MIIDFNFENHMKMIYRLIIGIESFMLAIMLVISISGPKIEFFFPAILKHVPSDFELPLGKLNSIAVDNDENIYLASETSRRIQVFDKNGKFIRGLSVEPGRGDLRLNIDKNNYLEVYRGSGLYIYDSEGNFLRQGDLSLYDGGLSGAGSEYKTEKGTYYIDTTIKRAKDDYYTYPNVLKEDLSGKKTVVISKPFFLLWIITSPLTPLLLVIGLILAIIASPIIEKQIKSNTVKYHLEKLQENSHRSVQMPVGKSKKDSQKQLNESISRVMKFSINIIFLMIAMGLAVFFFAFLRHIYTAWPNI